MRSFTERTAMNTPIQGTAADIMKLAMIRAEKNLREAMENVIKLTVPLIVDVHSGADWSLAK